MVRGRGFRLCLDSGEGPDQRGGPAQKGPSEQDVESQDRGFIVMFSMIGDRGWQEIHGERDKQNDDIAGVHSIPQGGIWQTAAMLGTAAACV